MKTLTFQLILLLLIGSCAAPRQKTVLNQEEFSAQVTYLRLSDYFRKVPGLTVSNGRVMLRGITDLENGEPLYVVNGVPIGNSYAQAESMVDPNDIQSVKVLRDVASTTRYGQRGYNGVIEILTKSGNDSKD